MPTFSSSSFRSPTPVEDQFESALDLTDLPPLQYYTLPQLPSTLPARNLQIPTPDSFISSKSDRMHRKSSSLPHFPTFKREIDESQSTELTQQQIVSSLPLVRRKKKGVYKVKNLIISDWVKGVEDEEGIRK